MPRLELWNLKSLLGEDGSCDEGSGEGVVSGDSGTRVGCGLGSGGGSGICSGVNSDVCSDVGSGDDAVVSPAEEMR